MLGKINSELLTLFALHIKTHSTTHTQNTHTHTNTPKYKLNPLSTSFNPLTKSTSGFPNPTLKISRNKEGKQRKKYKIYVYKKKTFKDDTLDKTHKTELFNYESLLIKPKESKESKTVKEEQEEQALLSSTSNSNKPTKNTNV